MTSFRIFSLVALLCVVASAQSTVTQSTGVVGGAVNDQISVKGAGQGTVGEETLGAARPSVYVSGQQAEDNGTINVQSSSLDLLTKLDQQTSRRRQSQLSASSRPGAQQTGGGDAGVTAADFLPSPRSGERPLSHVDLLALKVDESLMSGLSQWLAKYNIQLPPSLMSRIEQLELCPENAKDGLAHYCTKMADGQYYDPWNPWCGYIDCEHGIATRIVCMRGTWMGFGGGSGDSSGTGVGGMVGSGQPMLMTKDDICRRQLKQQIHKKACPAQTDYNLCSMATAMDQQRIEQTQSPPTPSISASNSV